ncbi:type II secretion system protein, partial [Klebsiella pneumoniae]|uniref:type II secretion system protein n=1 Tax=Klebsiella pneumoniae TaxID=573 RepID=UPI003CF7D105
LRRFADRDNPSGGCYPEGMRKSRGSSLIEVMIAVAMLSGVAYGIITLIRSSLNSQKSLQAQDDARSLTDAFAMVLADSKA